MGMRFLWWLVKAVGFLLCLLFFAGFPILGAPIMGVLLVRLAFSPIRRD